MGRKILFITTDQQRYDSLGCNGGTIARTPVVDALARDRHQLPARVQPEHRLHAGALDDAHRPVRAHARRRRQRRAAARRRAERRRVPAREGRLPHRAARQGALRARLRPRAAVAREPHGARGLTGPYRGFEHAELAMHVPAFGERPLQHYGRWLIDNHGLEATKGFSPLLAARARRRHRRARDAHQPDPARVVPHRLGRRSHDRVPRLARPTTPTGSCGCRSPIRTTRGTRPRVEQHRVQLARPRPAARPPRAATRRSSASSRRSRALARPVGGHVRQRRGRARHASARRTSATTTSARSTR